MEAQIKKILIDNSNELFGAELPDNLIQFQQTRNDVEGDLTLVVFPFVKIMRCSPVEAGNIIGEFIGSRIEGVESFNVVNGFLNFIIGNEFWLNKLSEIDASKTFGISAPNSGSTLMVEYSSPNTNKPLHLGHLRNIFLGHSVASILKANGHKVISTQIVNDRGIHICKSMLAWRKYSPENKNGEKETPANTGLKGDKLVGKYYVLFDQKMNEEIARILESWGQNDFDGFAPNVVEQAKKMMSSRASKNDEEKSIIDGKLKELAKSSSELLREAQELLIKWESKDPDTYLMWSTMNSWVYEGFEVTYESMGVKFDKMYYESDTYIIGKELVLEGLKSGVFFKKDDGSVWIDLSEDGLDEKLVLRADGTAVYMTQDMGTAVDRHKDFPDLKGIVYTVGNEQDYHFKVLFLILKKLGLSWADNCSHLSYGMVELPKGMGRMKSREGTVVDADDLMQSMIDDAGDMTQERGHIEGMSEEEKSELYDTIGMGALKYYLLRVDPKKRIVFNPEESIELQGNTGPFIQYTHARIRSLIAKAGTISSWSMQSTLLNEEKELIKHMALYPETIKESGKNQSPALIANYTYELVKKYNHFYQSIPILIEENEELKNMRLTLSEGVAKIIKSAMDLLGVKVPNRM